MSVEQSKGKRGGGTTYDGDGELVEGDQGTSNRRRSGFGLVPVGHYESALKERAESEAYIGTSILINPTPVCVSSASLLRLVEEAAYSSDHPAHNETSNVLGAPSESTKSATSSGRRH